MLKLRRLYVRMAVPLEVLISDAKGTGWDECREVGLVFDDGTWLMATFYRDPKNRGNHWWEETGMAIVEDLTNDRVLPMIDEILERGVVEDFFEPILDGYQIQ